jgi:hypothetical protein
MFVLVVGIRAGDVLATALLADADSFQHLVFVSGHGLEDVVILDIAVATRLGIQVNDHLS